MIATVIRCKRQRNRQVGDSVKQRGSVGGRNPSAFEGEGELRVRRNGGVNSADSEERGG